MPTSNYMADVTVAIAFNAGYLTPAASRTWTDITDYVELDQGITINVGRQDERSTADANTLSLTLDNRDGRFTATKTSGPYGANLKLGRPIRVQADPVDGAIQTEFVGFIDELPVEWSDDTDATSYVTITASSRLSRLGLQAALKSIIETNVLSDSPKAYYTLGEPEGSTQANDSSGLGVAPMAVVGDPQLPLVFGTATGPGTDSLTACQFVALGQSLSGGDAGGTYAGVSIEAFVLFPNLTSGAFIAGSHNASGAGISLRLDSTGVAICRVSNGSGFADAALAGTTNIADGNTHHVAGTYDGATISVYVDGVLVDTTAYVTTPTLGLMEVGAGGGNPGVFNDMTVSHVAAFGTALSAARVLVHSGAGLAGFAGDLTSARLVRYAGYAGVPTSEISTETGQTTVAHVDATDKQPVELMRLMESTEGGFLFDARDGTLTFHNRTHRLNLSSSYTLDMAQHAVEAGYAPKVDRSAIANDVSAANVAGTYSARVIDSTSQTDHGVATLSLETASEDNDEPLFQAGWALYKFKDPKVRVPNLTVQALAQVGKTPNCSTVMATNPGDKITVSNHPSQAAASSASYFVEGYTKVYGPESLLITFNLSPSSPEDTTFIVGDATRGVVGTNPIAL